MRRAELNERDFVRVRTLLGARAGLVFDESRRDSLAYAVCERHAVSGLPTVSDYLDTLDTAAGVDELQALLNDVTIQETHFFRNPPQFRALRQHVLPQLIRKAASGDRRLRVWSAGCSTGEEPYSVAMLIRELLPLTEGWDIKVMGTDISTRALAAAREGRYAGRTLAATSATDMSRWFIKGAEEHVVRPEIRELVEFRHHNLVSEPPPFGPDEPVDLLLCRNVTIYFSRDTTRRLMDQFHRCLSDGGYLFLGHSETLWQISDRFRLVTLGDAFVYRRDTEPDAGAAPERRTVLPDRRTASRAVPPDGVERRVKDRRAGVRDVLTKPIALHRAPRPVDTPVSGMALIEEARRLLAAGHYEQAADVAARLADDEPLRADAHYLRGLALANLARDREALVELRKAVYVDPTAGFAHFLLAGVLSRLGDTVAAARSYRAAAETLGRNEEDHVAAELGGRSVGELVDLCWQLAGVRRGS